ncbi:MAG: FtsQ-type POTRA domain-containing protein, partial [Rectinema sp.]|nr:FtsQ-type POTRA domain-containing protein [Rectinema sp.]
MTELELQHAREANTADSREGRTPGVLLSIPDTYSVSLPTRTIRRETSIPGTDAASGFGLKEGDRQRVAARTKRQHPVGEKKEPDSQRGSVFLHYPHASPVTARLAGPAERLNQELRDQARARSTNINRSFLLRFLGAIVLICLVAAGLAVLLPRLTRIEHVRIEGLMSLSKQTVLEALGPIGNESLLTVDVNAIVDRLQQNPRIARAKVYRLLPSTLGVAIVERTAVVGVLAEGNQSSRLVLIDAEGVAFAELDPSDSRVPSLPILSGIRFSKFEAGQ